MKTPSRRSLLKGAAATAGGVALAAVPAQAMQTASPERKAHTIGPKPDKTPLFNSAVSYGNLLFLAGIGAHFPGDIKAHTAHVLDELQKQLENAGSSMSKVLKVNVYLNDIKDWEAMNTVYAGRWGDTPPVRTTIAAAGGIPGNSLVEMDCIAFI
ncbi:MAG TPA: RidA family protein [Alloacidobacterium sp.]|jgi:2-iminobutanoate/2-iminopropanoate deaminase|nr:RidA family protein [Alloacidobacterium sp.]